MDHQSLVIVQCTRRIHHMSLVDHGLINLFHVPNHTPMSYLVSTPPVAVYDAYDYVFVCLFVCSCHAMS
jgi:hypothetical protein